MSYPMVTDVSIQEIHDEVYEGYWKVRGVSHTWCGWKEGAGFVIGGTSFHEPESNHIAEALLKDAILRLLQ